MSSGKISKVFVSEHRLEEQLLGASMFLAAGSVSGTAASVGRHSDSEGSPAVPELAQALFNLSL